MTVKKVTEINNSSACFVASNTLKDDKGKGPDFPALGSVTHINNTFKAATGTEGNESCKNIYIGYESALDTVFGATPGLNGSIAVKVVLGKNGFFNKLYQTEVSDLEDGGQAMIVKGVNSVDAVVGGLFVGNSSGNYAPAAALAASVMTTGSESLRKNMSLAVQRASNVAAGNPELGRVAFSQLFGEHALAAVSSGNVVSQNFSASVGNHQTQVRDARMSQQNQGHGAEPAHQPHDQGQERPCQHSLHAAGLRLQL